jgi:hypothetical protein
MNFAELVAHKEQMFLSEIADKGANQLRVEICLGGHHPLPRDIMGKHIDEISRMPIRYTEAAYYELKWDRYFSFMVRDEGAAAFRKDEEFEGHGIRRFEKSWLLTMIPELSNGLHEIPRVRGKLTHYGLYCANHIVDVLAYEDPAMRDLGLRALDSRMPNQPLVIQNRL